MDVETKDTYQLPGAVIAALRRQNPWWQGEPAPDMPRFRRWPFGKLLERLLRPLAPVVALKGPRQVGKTTLQQQVIQQLLADGVRPVRLFRIQFDDLTSLRHIPAKDDPVLRMVDWYERHVLGQHLNRAARDGEHAYLFLDEVQNLPGWDAQLKSLVDHAAVRVLVTGSSALRIERGRDSLAGRIHTVETGPLRLFEVAALRELGELPPFQPANGWHEWTEVDFWRGLRAHGQRHAACRDAAFEALSAVGAYPFAHRLKDVPWADIADHLNETVVRRVIRHDLRLGDRGRKRDEGLLEQVFRMACRYAGQAPNPATLAREASEQLGAGVGPLRLRHYVDFLDGALLVRAIPPLELRLRKRKGWDKLCLCDHALRAAWLQEDVPLVPRALEAKPHLADLAGHLAESAVGYHLATLGGLDVAHKPQRGDDPEVDFVLTIGTRRIPIEVKYRARLDEGPDAAGLRAFLDRPANEAPFGLLVTRDDDQTVRDPRVVCLPLSTLLLVR